MNSKRSILIVGTGALATLFAARFSAAGADVTMLGTWPDGLRALHRDGARLVDADGVEHAHPVRAVDDPAKCRGARHALVLVKAWQTERAARQLADCLNADGLAVTLQNGLGNGEILARTLGLPRVAQGVTTTGATLLSPGLARAGGEGVVSIETHPRLGPLGDLLTEAGFNVREVNEAQPLIWEKLVINAAINPLTALLDVPNGELLERPSARTLMGALARETASVAAAQGISLSFDDPAAAAEDVARRTASNHSSMLQDMRRSAPTEIEAICGAITRAGEQHGIPTPVNRVCWQLITALAQGK
ncbi:MAG: 2-dehydropantoate 2-reductase [Chloroflexi bacterium]|nr:2-dehydropantoate 2-reductase [Chloroflexota bacterium]